jgi:hypothetical protein
VHVCHDSPASLYSFTTLEIEDHLARNFKSIHDMMWTRLQKENLDYIPDTDVDNTEPAIQKQRHLVAEVIVDSIVSAVNMAIAALRNKQRVFEVRVHIQRD